MIRIGFDIGGTNIKAGLFDEDMKYLSRRISSFPKEYGYRSVVKTMHEVSADMLAENGMTKEEVGSVGIASAGWIDILNGIITRAYNLDFYDVPICEEVRRHFPDIPVSLVNDADAAALAELYIGALKGYNNAILLTIGTGIGCGIIINGKLFSGGLSHGTEAGHSVLCLGGLPCTCGGVGCIETLCSATWLVKKGQNLGYKDAKSVIDAARTAESDALKIYDDENLTELIYAYDREKNTWEAKFY